MGMLKSISLENYKCFEKLKVDDKEELEIAPLTVLCGVNSSGKSSIIKSLLMMKQSYEDNTASNFMVFNGKYVDNGSFSDILYDNAKENKFTISDSFEIGTKTDKFSKDFTNLRDLRRLYYNNNIEKFVIHYSITLVNGDGLFFANKIDKINIKIDIYKHEYIDYTSSIILNKKNKNKYSINFYNIPDVSGIRNSINMGVCTCYFGSMSLNSIYQEGIKPGTKLFIPTIISIFNIISNQYLQIRYIAPLRENPKRRYIVDKNIDSVGVSGEYTPLLLKKISKRDWNGILAPDSEENFFLIKENITIKDTFFNILNSWMKYMELGDVLLDERQDEIVKVKINNHNIADVGFGVSQVLPILTEGIYMSPAQTLLLEQPEIHLHPKMQMAIADFLLSLSVQNKSIIVETHSDHFINRLVKRIMLDKTGQLNKNICIYFIDKDSQNPVERIKITPTKGIVSAPTNFFTQFASESMDIAKIGFTNHKEGVSWICNE